MAGQLVHFEVLTDDTAAARAFWGTLFGWTFEAFPGPVDYSMARLSETTGAAISGTDPGTRGTRAYFDVDDIDAAIASVTELGGESGERLPVPGMGWFAVCRDPAGNEFGLWQNDPTAPTPEM